MSTDSKLEALREFEAYAAEAGLDLTRFDGIAAPWCSIETSRHWQTWRAAHEAEQEQAGEAVAVPNLDPDGDTSRAGFAAMDAELVARWMSPWQVWREAVRWSTGQRAIHGITKDTK